GQCNRGVGAAALTMGPSRSLAVWLLVGVVLGTTPRAGAEIEPGSAPIDHLIVVYLENHTFDNLFGLFPGANGLAAPGAARARVPPCPLRAGGGPRIRGLRRR